MSHKACPFCGGDAALLPTIAGAWEYARCNACDVEGPCRQTKDEAWEAWDIRTCPDCAANAKARAIAEQHLSQVTERAEAAEAEIQHPGLIDWLVGGKVGISSMTIVTHIAGIQGRFWPDTPRDSGDFRRCVDLLNAVPSLRPVFPKMAEVSPVWAKLVERWDELERDLSADRGLCSAKILRIVKEAPDA